MIKRAIGLTLPAVFFCVGLSAQVAWESPFFMPPGSAPGLGIYLVDHEPGGLGALFTYRRASAPVGVGLRGGLAEEAGGGLSFLGGVDIAGSLVPASNDVPIDVMWVIGAGAGIGNEIWIAVPAGISVGATIEGEGVTLVPYATPRVILDVITGPGDDLFLNFAVDLGLNLSFNPNWELRFAATVGDHEGVAVGVNVPLR